MRFNLPLMSLLGGLILCGQTMAADYPIFDGQRYNGKFYPRIDIIEWGRPAHLEFHIYEKAKPVEIQARAIERNGKRVLLVNYFLSERGEKVCRSVIAPANFAPEAALYFYRDRSDREYDNIYVTMSPLPATRNLETYAATEFSTSGCEEADAATNNPNGRAVASESGNKAPVSMVGKDEGRSLKTPQNTPAPENKKHELIDYQNNAMPFNF